MAGMWELHEETIRKRLKVLSDVMYKQSKEEIVWGNFEIEEIFLCSVDGTHCPIQEVRQDPSSKWYSHKFNGPGLAYELAVAIKTSRLLSIRGPFPASTHDITIFRGGKVDDEPKDAEALYFKIPDGKRAIGDSGYKGSLTISRMPTIVNDNAHVSSHVIYG